MMTTVPLDKATEHAWRQAWQSRDAHYDGRFFVGVVTTGIFCRTVCRVRRPNADNVRFFENASGAMASGFRPCLHCQPELAPGARWQRSAGIVAHALRLMESSPSEYRSVSALANTLSVSRRHLGRAFRQELGSSVQEFLQSRRLMIAKQLLDETTLTVTDVAIAAGYGSVRRFNAHCLEVYGRSPTVLRGKVGQAADEITLSIPYRQPYDFESVLAYLAIRSMPNEQVNLEKGSWSRTEQQASPDDLQHGSSALQVTNDSSSCLRCQISLSEDNSRLAAVPDLMGRVRRIFDVNADPSDIKRVLSQDDVLAPLVQEMPGLRLPGAFSPFECAVRAIVGQQISVAAATTVIRAMADKAGGLSPMALLSINEEDFPMPSARARTIRSLAKQVCEGEIRFDAVGDILREGLLAIRGIGPWTADYVAMRAGSNPDVFLATDLGVKKRARRLFGFDGEVELRARADAWRPYGGYAVMHLWLNVSQEASMKANADTNPKIENKIEAQSEKNLREQKSKYEQEGRKDE